MQTPDNGLSDVRYCIACVTRGGLEISPPTSHKTHNYIDYITTNPTTMSVLRPLTTINSSSAPYPPPSSVPRRKEPPRRLSINYLNRIRNAQGWKAGERVLLDIEKDGYTPNAFHYSAIISKCAKKKQSGKALELLKRMITQGVAPSAPVFCAAIDACAKVGQYKSAISLLNDMEDTYGVKPTVKCFSAAITSCEKAAKWEEAVKLLRKMAKKGVKPDVVVYSSVISACEKCAEWEKALEFLAEMEEVGVPPNVVSYNATISACEKGRQPVSALSLLAQMKEKGTQPNVVSYSSTISACEKGGAKYTDAALSMFAEMKKAGINPDDAAYIAITKACFDSNRYPETLELVREAADLHLLVNGRSVCINMSMENGQPKWDLHDLSEAMACMLLADALLSLVHSSNERMSPKYQDVIVVTGKGLNTEDPNGPVLREKVPVFLNDIAGLETTVVGGNEGRFLITAVSVEEWATSGGSEKFNGLF